MLSNEGKLDPRVIRTRKLLMESFLQLQYEKDFNDITIQDIADRATVNRATFYAHFQDKYALLDNIIHDGFQITLQKRLCEPSNSPQAYLRQLFLAVTDHLGDIQSRCQRSLRTFGSLVEAQIKAQLREALLSYFASEATLRAVPKPRQELVATMISWSIYGAALEWQHQAHLRSAESFAEEALPFIVAMMSELRA
jgi:AcrR family transcriptional regulator